MNSSYNLQILSLSSAYGKTERLRTDVQSLSHNSCRERLPIFLIIIVPVEPISTTERFISGTVHTSADAVLKKTAAGFYLQTHNLWGLVFLSHRTMHFLPLIIFRPLPEKGRPCRSKPCTERASTPSVHKGLPPTPVVSSFQLKTAPRDVEGMTSLLM